MLFQGLFKARANHAGSSIIEEIDDFVKFWQIYANLGGFRLLHLKISKKFRKDRIVTTSYRIEVEGCCYISIYFLKY